MATTTPERETAPRPRGDRSGDRTGHRLGWLASLRHALDRPLTSYYLLLGASALSA